MATNLVNGTVPLSRADEVSAVSRWFFLSPEMGEVEMGNSSDADSNSFCLLSKTL